MYFDDYDEDNDLIGVLGSIEIDDDLDEVEFEPGELSILYKSSAPHNIESEH